MVCVHTARSPERIWFMEYHWYEVTGISPDVLQRDTLLAAGIILQAVY